MHGKPFVSVRIWARLDYFPLLIIVIFLSTEIKTNPVPHSRVYIVYTVELHKSQCLLLQFFPLIYPVEVVFTLIERSREQFLCLYGNLIFFRNTVV